MVEVYFLFEGHLLFLGGFSLTGSLPITYAAYVVSASAVDSWLQTAKGEWGKAGSSRVAVYSAGQG